VHIARSETLSRPRQSQRVLRLFRYRPARAAFDTLLRDVMLPDLVRLDGLEAVVVGRQGPDDLGERIHAMVWSSQDAMVRGVGASFDRPVFHPELMDETVDKRLDIGPIVCSVQSGAGHPVQLIRLLFGETRAGELEHYLAAAAAGAHEDIRRGHGPLSLTIASLGGDRFVTVSTWGQWSTLAEATDGTISRPDATRHQELLESWHVEHYESIPDVPEIPSRATSTPAFGARD
jgi:hypothetical protein